MELRFHSIHYQPKKQGLESGHEKKHGHEKDNEETVLLNNLLDRNRYHAEKLAEFSDNLSGSGKTEESELARKAAACLLQCNNELEKVLSSLEKKN
jgi:hypothetical protein